MDLDGMEAGRSWKLHARAAPNLAQGGAAHLDGGYTVFGRLLDGWGTVDKIQRVETDDNNRPLKNVIIKRMRLYTRSSLHSTQIQADAPHQLRGGASVSSFAPRQKYRAVAVCVLIRILTTLKASIEWLSQPTNYKLTMQQNKAGLSMGPSVGS